MSVPHVFGLVLSGGRSSRMGRDKGELIYHEKPQRLHVSDMLQSLGLPVFLSCSAAQKDQFHDYPVITDLFEEMGPLNGLLSAFAQNGTVAWLMVACDLPFLTAGTIAHLLSHRQPDKLATVYRDVETGFPEPMVSLWEPAALPALNAFVKAGGRSPARFLTSQNVAYLTAPDPAEFRNVNTQEEYEAALKQLKG